MLKLKLSILIVVITTFADVCGTGLIYNYGYERYNNMDDLYEAMRTLWYLFQGRTPRIAELKAEGHYGSYDVKSPQDRRAFAEEINQKTTCCHDTLHAICLDDGGYLGNMDLLLRNLRRNPLSMMAAWSVGVHGQVAMGQLGRCCDRDGEYRSQPRKACGYDRRYRYWG